jgi:hypothetical protein
VALGTGLPDRVDTRVTTRHPWSRRDSGPVHSCGPAPAACAVAPETRENHMLPLVSVQLSATPFEPRVGSVGTADPFLVLASAGTSRSAS